MLLASEVRGKTLRLLDGVSESEARFAPAGLNNTILWHAGHALVVVEHLSVAPATGGPPSYPAAWFETFSWKSVPATVTCWPTLDEVVERLREQLTRLRVAIESLPPERLAGMLASHLELDRRVQLTGVAPADRFHDLGDEPLDLLG